MSTKTIEKELTSLKREVASLRSLVVSVVTRKDPEGEYKPEFVREVLKATKEPANHTFKGSKAFLKQLRSV